jgi:hypothetical protein
MANGAPQPKPPQTATGPTLAKPGTKIKVAPAVVPKKKKKAPKKYTASCFPPKNAALPQEFVSAVQRVEAILKTPVWLLIQDPPGEDQSILSQAPPCHTLDDSILRAFRMSAKSTLPKSKPPVLIIESPGGQAESAYRIACFLRQHCGGIPSHRTGLREECGYLVDVGCGSNHLVRKCRTGTAGCSDIRSQPRGSRFGAQRGPSP